MRFPGFDDEWVDTCVRDLCIFKNGKAHENEIDVEGKYVVVNSKFISSEGKVRKHSNNQISPLYKGEIVMVMSDVPNGKALAKCFLINESNKFTLNQRICSLNSINNHNPFLIYLINRNPFYLAFDSKVGQTNLKKDDVLDCPLTIPKSINEQIKIAAFLSLLDNRIETQNKIIEQLESLIKSLSEIIFNQKIRFKNTADKKFPDWEIKKLREVATITTGASNREDSILDGEYIFFDRSQDIRTSNRYLFDKEAVIVAGEGQKFVPKYFMGKFDLHQRTYAIFDFKNINGKYLYYHISHDDKHLQSHAVGSTVKSLRLPMFQSMPIKFPCIEEQIHISNFITSVCERIETEEKILNQYQKQKSYLLVNLFI